MSAVFGAGYASSYDLLYGDKDYIAECELIDKTIRKYSRQPAKTILDLGCGTGNHSLPLAERGYEVVGVDRSEEMLAQARSKSRTNAVFLPGDIRTADVGKPFDCALMMFAVLGYQLENQDVEAALKNARRHLHHGGILIFDVWYGPAVLHLRPSERAKIIAKPEGEIVRFASGTLNGPRQICTVSYRVWHVRDNQVVARVEESHQMRYFFPLEIELLLNSAGFRILRIGAFPEIDREANENTWNVMVVAKAM
jgi:SAM-dependent methyltransferase